MAAVTQPVHVIACGGRHFVPRPDDATRLCQYLARVTPCVLHHGDCPHRPTPDCPPGCTSADQWAARLAARMTGVTVVAHPADWDAHGKQAGPIRNVDMFRKAHDAASRPPTVIAYPGGRGTAHMVAVAREGRARVVRPHDD